jgi:ribosomal protein L37AE/L43A
MLEVEHECENCGYPAVVRVQVARPLAVVVWHCVECGRENATAWNWRTMEGADAEVGSFSEKKKRSRR